MTVDLHFKRESFLCNELMSEGRVGGGTQIFEKKLVIFNW